MSTQEYEYPNCWIRGEMDEKDYQDDPVSLETIRCPHRKGQIRPFFFGTTHEMDYDCTHPAVGPKDEVQGARKIPGGYMAGTSVDDFKTFCVPVDMHLTSLGEPSQLVIEGEWTEVKKKPEPEAKPQIESSKQKKGLLRRLLRPRND